MFVIISCFRFIHAFSLILFALTMLTLPLVTNAAQDPSLARSSTVLAQGQEIRDGLTSLQAMPKGISGSFEQDGKIVYFETRRGSRTPKHLRNGDPSTPDYEIDVRFMDQDGKPFLIQIGGDAPVENTWEISTPKAKVEEEAQADFQLAAKTVGALKKLKFNKKFAHEHQALLNLASVMESAQVVEKVEGLPSQPLSATAQATGDIYRHIIQMHDKSCCLGLGRHSATIGKYVTDAGVTTTAVITCNHGTCANQMALKCRWSSAYPGNRSTRVNNDITCATTYNATSVFGHNSNDDTDLQYRAVRNNTRPSTTGGTCNDANVNNEPTSCY